MKVTDLEPGDQVFGWLKIGFALKKGRTPGGRVYMYVPSKPSRFDNDDLQQFSGLVVRNDTEKCILSLEVSRMNRFLQAVGETLPVEIHYRALKRLRFMSQHAYPAREEYPARPTRRGIGTGFNPYRTLVEVKLTWN